MVAEFRNVTMTPELLNSEPNSYFVYSDNLLRQGMEGTASMRTHPRAIGFPVAKAPLHVKGACFKPDEYSKIFFDQLKQLVSHVQRNQQHKFYVSRLGDGDANRYYIWQTLVHHNLITDLQEFDNVVFCWEPESLVTQ